MGDHPQFIVPPGLEAGVYADEFAVWNTAHAFVLDFAAADAPQSDGPDTEAHLVARVRLPTSLVFSFLQAVNAKMGEYEHDWGEIRAPRRRGDDGEEDNS